MINLGISLSPWLKYFCTNLGRTKTGKKRCYFTSEFIQSHQSNHQLKSRGGLHIKMGKRKLMNEKMSLSKSRRWHGFNEKEEFCCQNNCWGQCLPLLKGGVLRATGGAGSGLTLDQPPGRGAPRCQQSPEHVHRHCQAVVQAGSWAGAAPGQDLTLSFAFWAA